MEGLGPQVNYLATTNQPLHLSTDEMGGLSWRLIFTSVLQYNCNARVCEAKHFIMEIVGDSPLFDVLCWPKMVVCFRPEGGNKKKSSRTKPLVRLAKKTGLFPRNGLESTMEDSDPEISAGAVTGTYPIPP